MELNRAYALHEKLRGCTIKQICEALANIHDSWQAEVSDMDDDLIPIIDLGKERAAKRTRSCMPGIVDTTMQDSAGHHPFVQVSPLYG